MTKLEELAQSQTVILDDLARVKAGLLLIRTFLPEDDAAQLFRPLIFDERTDFYNIILQQSWILICILITFVRILYFSTTLLILSLCQLLSISQILAVAF